MLFRSFLKRRARCPSPRSLSHVFSETPFPAGSGQQLAIDPDGRARGGGSRISVRVFTLTAERGSLSWQCVYGISPIEGGGGGDAPPSPVSRVSLKTSLAGSPPPPRRDCPWKAVPWMGPVSRLGRRLTRRPSFPRAAFAAVQSPAGIDLFIVSVTIDYSHGALRQRGSRFGTGAHRRRR